VFLIGAGPGATDLITLRAVRALAHADVVLIDELVDRALLAHCRDDVKVLAVGKRGGCRSTPQAFIQRLMLRYARQGRTVARLKGGDPFVFGRGGEELAFLRAHGVAVEVVPGLTAGIAVPTALGIPVTHRGIARGVTLVTGHAADGAEPDWPALARTGTTLVVYMGLKRLAHVAERLLEAGMAASTPAAVISSGTLATERAVHAELGAIAQAAAARQLASPALIVVGEVLAFAARHADDAAEATPLALRWMAFARESRQT
jgi:uroporphyrin-III C-methyltransferase